MTDANESGRVAMAELFGWPPIPVMDDEVIVGRTSRCTVVVQHDSVSREHFRVVRRNDLVEVEDLDSRFGTFVNKLRIKRKVLKPGDVLSFGNSPLYRFEKDCLLPDLRAEGMPLCLHGVVIRTRERKSLLGPVDLTIGASQFVGIIGPSGAGKSVLLESLASTRLPSEGVILFDDGLKLDEHLEEYLDQSGHVPQDPVIYKELTVEENLHSAAQIRLSKLKSTVRNARVDAAMNALELTKHCSTRAGQLSGGQQKRLSIALELIREPRLLILDEPTSGLDARTQLSLMDRLRYLTQRGVTAICTTHTLDSSHFFDTVIAVGRLNGVGNIRYSGPPDGLLSAFGARNASDLYDKLEGETVPEQGQPSEPVAEDVESELTEPRSGSSPMLLRAARLRLQRSRTVDLHLQTWAVLNRSWHCFWRDAWTWRLSLAQPVVLAVLVVLSQHRQSSTTFMHFFLIIAALWMGMTLTARELVHERPLYQRDRLAGLNRDAYLTGKALIALLLLTGQVLLLFLVARLLMLGLLDPLDTQNGGTAEDLLEKTSKLWTILVLMAVGIGGVTIGFIISALSRTERAAFVWLPIVIMPQLLLSRVAYGDAAWGWGHGSPFAPMWIWLQEPDWAFGNVLVMLGSLPMLTRSATVVLDMRGHAGAFSFELIYFVALLAIHATILYMVFRRREGRFTLR